MTAPRKLLIFFSQLTVIKKSTSFQEYWNILNTLNSQMWWSSRWQIVDFLISQKWKSGKNGSINAILFFKNMKNLPPQCQESHRQMEGRSYWDASNSKDSKAERWGATANNSKNDSNDRYASNRNVTSTLAWCNSKWAPAKIGMPASTSDWFEQSIQMKFSKTQWLN